MRCPLCLKFCGLFLWNIPHMRAQWQDIIHVCNRFRFEIWFHLTTTQFAQFNEMGIAIFTLLLITVMSLCPATCSFMFLMILHWTTSIYLFCCGVILPVIMHMNPGLRLVLLTYDHWCEWQPYLYKQISFYLVCRAAVTWLQLFTVYYFARF